MTCIRADLATQCPQTQTADTELLSVLIGSEPLTGANGHPEVDVQDLLEQDLVVGPGG